MRGMWKQQELKRGAETRMEMTRGTSTGRVYVE